MIQVRAAFHVHSDWSYDGKWPLDRIARAFQKRGYQIVMLTEHDRGFDEARRQDHREACRRASSDDILLVPGIEYSDSANLIHILTWGNVPFAGENIQTAEVLAAVEAANGVAVFAHPSRKAAWKSFDRAWRDRILGIECWNRKTDGWAPSRDAWGLLEMTQSLAFVGLDFHDSRQFFPLATTLELERPVSEDAVLASLRSRHCMSKAFGMPVRSFGNGGATKTLRCAEWVRRRVAFLFRKMTVRARPKIDLR